MKKAFAYSCCVQMTHGIDDINAKTKWYMNSFSGIFYTCQTKNASECNCKDCQKKKNIFPAFSVLMPSILYFYCRDWIESMCLGKYASLQRFTVARFNWFRLGILNHFLCLLLSFNERRKEKIRKVNSNLSDAFLGQKWSKMRINFSVSIKLAPKNLNLCTFICI